MADLDVSPTRTEAPLDEQSIAIINEVLEGERGSALALVQLAAMATDAFERHALVVQGGQAAQACIDLRSLLGRHNAPASIRVGDAAMVVQELERLDERYRAFGELQQRLMAAIESIPSQHLEAPAQATLAMVHTVQAAHAAWALQRAQEFTVSREEVVVPTGWPISDELAVNVDEPAAPPTARTFHDTPSVPAAEPDDHANLEGRDTEVARDGVDALAARSEVSASANAPSDGVNAAGGDRPGDS